MMHLRSDYGDLLMVFLRFPIGFFLAFQWLSVICFLSLPLGANGPDAPVVLLVPLALVLCPANSLPALRLVLQYYNRAQIPHEFMVVGLGVRCHVKSLPTEVGLVIVISQRRSKR